MDRRSLVIEKPALTQVVLDETDGLLNETTRELADYAATHLGYGKLSSRLYQEKTEHDQKIAVAAQTNNLAAALQKADINVYSEKSVNKYKKSKVRHGWIKFILNVEECALWVNLFFLVPAVAALMFLCGWLSGWQSVVMAALFQFPSVLMFCKEFQDFKGGERIGVPLLFVGPMTGLVLAVANCGRGWTAITFLLAAFGVSCLLGEFTKQLRDSRIYWDRVPVEGYKEDTPLFALSKMMQIHQLCPSAVFSIEELKADIYLPDPFLVASDSVTGKDFYIEVWGEKKFETKYS
jgi:hypothetical protein